MRKQEVSKRATKADGMVRITIPDSVMRARSRKKQKLVRVTAAEDAAINAGIAADPDTYEVSAEEFKQMRPVRASGRPKSPAPKLSVTMRLDPDIVKFFRDSGAGWQTRLNAVLRKFVTRQRVKG